LKKINKNYSATLVWTNSRLVRSTGPLNLTMNEPYSPGYTNWRGPFLRSPSRAALMNSSRCARYLVRSIPSLRLSSCCLVPMALHIVLSPPPLQDTSVTATVTFNCARALQRVFEHLASKGALDFTIREEAKSTTRAPKRDDNSTAGPHYRAFLQTLVSLLAHRHDQIKVPSAISLLVCGLAGLLAVCSFS